MNKIVEMRKAIGAFLLTLHSDVHYQVVSKGAAPLHVVFDFTNSIDDGSMERFVLEVDGWDSRTDLNTIPLENMMYAIDGDGDRVNPTGLHRKTFTLDGLGFVIYRENRINLFDENPLIRRRKYIYQIRTFVGG